MKNGVILYYDLLSQLEDFSDEQFGKIIRAIIRYDKDEIIPVFADKTLEIVFKMLKPILDHNKEQYRAKCQQNRVNVQKRWGKNTDVYDRIRPYTNDTNYTDTDNDTDIDIDTNIKERKKESKKTNNNICISARARTRERMTYDEIFVAFCVEPALKDILIEFIRHCQLNGKTLTNDKLQKIIVALDLQHGNDTTAKIRSVQNAISGGYFDVIESKDQ